MLCQSLNAEFGRRGIHIAHIVVDGPVDAPDTLGKMLGAENFQELRKTVGANDGLLDPAQVAEPGSLFSAACRGSHGFHVG